MTPTPNIYSHSLSGYRYCAPNFAGRVERVAHDGAHAAHDEGCDFAGQGLQPVGVWEVGVGGRRAGSE